MNKNVKKLLEIICIYCTSVLLTILIFWETNTYSFSARPTELVFWRMLFLSLTIAATIETLFTILRIIQNKKIEKRNEKTVKNSSSEPKGNNKKYTARDIRKKVLEIVGAYIASWLLVLLATIILRGHENFAPIEVFLLFVSFHACVLLVIIELAIIIVREIEYKIYHKTKHAANNHKKTTNTALEIIGTYTISLSLAINLYITAGQICVYPESTYPAFLKILPLSIAIMVFLETIWIVRRSINHD